ITAAVKNSCPEASAIQRRPEHPLFISWYIAACVAEAAFEVDTGIAVWRRELLVSKGVPMQYHPLNTPEYSLDATALERPAVSGETNQPHCCRQGAAAYRVTEK